MSPNLAGWIEGHMAAFDDGHEKVCWDSTVWIMTVFA